MSSYHEEQLHSVYAAFSTLPLPSAAVVIDVRHSEHQDQSLLDYLATNVDDLAMSMRLKQIPRWRCLSESIDFLLLNVLAPGTELHEETDFVLTTRAGQQIPLPGWQNLVSFIGRNYLDRVRNARISGTRDSNAELVTLSSDITDTEQPTVRVFFLADMEEQASLSLAGCCAQRLKIWTEEAHGPGRFSRAEYMQTAIFCLNTHPSAYHEVLLHRLGQVPDSAIDLVILQQRYGDDEAYIGGNAQVYQAELILHTLLLRWPEAFAQTIEDVRVLSFRANIADITPSWPIYIVGVSALEYSAHWAARWLNYGVASSILAMISNADLAEQDRPLNHIQMQKWLKLWWQDMQAAVPSELLRTADDMQAFDRLQRVLADPALQKVSPGQALPQLTLFCRQVSELYTGSGHTLQHALESKWSILEQIKCIYALKLTGDESMPQQADEPYPQLAHLYARARQILAWHFRGTEGALPRAMHQLSALTAGIDEIRQVASSPPDFADRRAQFEHQAEMAHKRLLNKLKTWPLPPVGNILRSTVISLCIVMLICTLVVSGIGWQPLLEQSYSFSSLFRLPGEIMTMIKIMFACLLLSCELFYLTVRNRSIQREYRHIHSELCSTVQLHLSEAGTVMASYVALEFLQRSDLYMPGADGNPYEQRLRRLTTVLQGVQERTARQHRLANARLQYALGTQQSRHLDEYRWSHLSNRKDIFLWDQVEETLLQSCNDLKANIASVDLFSEMLLRLSGTEGVAELLASVLNKQPQDEEARFQVISALLAGMVLSPARVLPEISAAFSLLKQYVALQDRSVEETSLLNANATDMQNILRKALLERAREQGTTSHASLSPGLATNLPAFILAGWVGSQLDSHSSLAGIFVPDNVLEHLMQYKEISPEQALETLRTLCTLSGHPDEIAGDDYYYLFISPGDASETFIEACSQLRESRIQQVPFPDQEKLVYLHIHRVRQILSQPLR